MMEDWRNMKVGSAVIGITGNEERKRALKGPRAA